MTAHSRTCVKAIQSSASAAEHGRLGLPSVRTKGEETLLDVEAAPLVSEERVLVEKEALLALEHVCLKKEGSLLQPEMQSLD